MKKHYIVVAGKKFYCDEKGLLEKDADNNFMEVPAEDTKATEVALEDATEEVAKMLKRQRTLS